MKTKIVVTMIIVAVISCFLVNYVAARYIPEMKKLREIKNIPYEFGAMDCCDKVYMYFNHLKSKGIEARLVSGPMFRQKFHHAWVEAKDLATGEWCVLDPTFKNIVDGYNRSYYTDRRTYAIFNQDATPEDIRHGRNIEKLFPLNRYYGNDSYYRRLSKYVIFLNSVGFEAKMVLGIVIGEKNPRLWVEIKNRITGEWRVADIWSWQIEKDGLEGIFSFIRKPIYILTLEDIKI